MGQKRDRQQIGLLCFIVNLKLKKYLFESIEKEYISCLIDISNIIQY